MTFRPRWLPAALRAFDFLGSPLALVALLAVALYVVLTGGI